MVTTVDVAELKLRYLVRQENFASWVFPWYQTVNYNITLEKTLQL